MIGGAVAMPIFQSSTFEYRGEQTNYHDLRYIRLSNTPNHDGAASQAGGARECRGGAGGGQRDGGDFGHAAGIARRGRPSAGAGLPLRRHARSVRGRVPALRDRTDFIDANEPASWREATSERTRAIYVETMSNPLMRVRDLNAVVEFAAAHGLVSIIDNTFASPMNFRPAEAGFDLSLHSGTKYLNGHTDIVAGAVIGRARPGREGSAQAQPSWRRRSIRTPASCCIAG